MKAQERLHVLPIIEIQNQEDEMCFGFINLKPLQVSKEDIRSGVGEIMKAALVHDKRLFKLMQVFTTNKMLNYKSVCAIRSLNRPGHMKIMNMYCACGFAKATWSQLD